MEKEKEELEVDCAYDWQTYLHEENLTAVKENWNNKRAAVKQIANIKASFGTPSW